MLDGIIYPVAKLVLPRTNLYAFFGKGQFCCFPTAAHSLAGGGSSNITRVGRRKEGRGEEEEEEATR